MRKGGTLIEIVIVIAILSVLAGILVPKIANSVALQELDIAAQELAADIRLVQQFSINAGYGSGALRYTIYFMPDSNPYYWIHDGQKMIKQIYLPKSVCWSNVPSTIRFGIKGIPEAGAAQTIQLRSTTGKSLYIMLAPFTGRVRITDVQTST
ncbi:MAG TPA: type II secretion system protein [Methylomusa anaerophila]|uniref:Prepilin-type N-terminal cleavage/methylation domain-containing protein n=1 Tax=Methylomusa anaerophila TaxID=1930071 RepID=A0A348AQH2_9FIRM|nr:type II secretion system protein [Methylomusa anaerophila]BBB93320.1 hypothetical protein MAMMFC1_04032 [Methylomusa anaerophila]HML86849.1 type II secretion system protein [Methylomusa anaerophila]